jgi:nucleoside-diphosphate-sugar epimerase
MPQQNILITGSTGFFGSRLLKCILTYTESEVYLLIRPGKSAGAMEKLKASFAKAAGAGKISRFLKRVTIVEGDITKRNLGIKSCKLKELLEKIDVIFHSAAELDIRRRSPEITRVNVLGTRNVLEFAYFCRNKGVLSKVNHISTAYIVGTKGMSNIIFYEGQLDISQAFNNLYEQSKYEAEIVVNEFRSKGLHVDIYRPSIMTESLPVKDVESFSLFFKPFRFLISGIFKEIPADINARYNFISVDDAARAILLISESPDRVDRNYQIVNPKHISLSRLLGMAVKVFGAGKLPVCVPLKRFAAEAMGRLTDVQRNLIGPFIPYLNFKARFDSKNAEEVLKKKKFSYRPLKDNEIESIFEYIFRNRMR